MKHQIDWNLNKSHILIKVLTIIFGRLNSNGLTVEKERGEGIDGKKTLIYLEFKTRSFLNLANPL